MLAGRSALARAFQQRTNERSSVIVRAWIVRKRSDDRHQRFLRRALIFRPQAFAAADPFTIDLRSMLLIARRARLRIAVPTPVAIARRSFEGRARGAAFFRPLRILRPFARKPAGGARLVNMLCIAGVDCPRPTECINPINPFRFMRRPRLLQLNA
jgi:hypothetical protein